MSLPAIECVRRGVANARANWELVLAQWLGAVATLVLGAASFAPLLLAIGFSDFDGARTPEQIAQAFAAWVGTVIGFVSESPVAFTLALAAGLVLSGLAVVAMSFFHAGVYGTLVAGDRQAPAGPPADWHLFRTFSGLDFRGWGARYTWRYFWFLNAWFALLTVLVGLAAILAVFAGAGAAKWGVGAALGIGCGGALPLVFLFLLFSVWANVALADLAIESSGTLAACRRAMRLVGRRIGGVALLFALGLAGSMIVNTVFMPFSFVVGLAFRSTFAGLVMARGLLTMVELGVSGLVQVALAASWVAMLRSELGEAVTA